MSVTKLQPTHLDRLAVVYIRQSSPLQVERHQESQRRQYQLADRAAALGWPGPRCLVIDDDLGISGAHSANRPGYQRLVSLVALREGGVIFSLEVSRLVCFPRKSPSPSSGGHRLGSRQRGERDAVSQRVQAPDVELLQAGRVQGIEVIRSQVGVGAPVAQHVVDADQQAVGDGHQRAPHPAPPGQPAELRPEIAVLAAGIGPGDLGQDSA